MADPLLLQAALVVAALAIAGTLADRVGQSVIPAYILVGLIVGPNAPRIRGVSLALIEHREFIDLLAELGIVLLLFFLGLEFRIDQLVEARDRLVAAGAVDAVVNLGVGTVLGVAFGFTLLETAFLAGIVYISSSAVITKSLLDLGWIADPESEAILGVLVFEDLLIAVYLALLAAVALGGGGLESATMDIAWAIGFLGVLFLVARYGGRYVERFFETGSDELFLLRVLGATTLIASAALVSGVSEAVAAFFVGTALGGTSHLERVERVLVPARDLFAAVFFFAIGLETDVAAIAAVAGILPLAVVATTASKFASGYAGGRLYGLSERRAARVGTGLVARGEFSLVIAALAASVGTGALATVIPAFAVGYVLVMSVLGTIMMRQGEWFWHRIGALGGSREPPDLDRTD
jgi:CPA2 family monovalent cation:H+ antiporter-2